MIRRPIAISLAGLCAAGLITAADAAPLGATAQSVSLRLGDLPAHFTQTKGAVTSAAQNAKAKDHDSVVMHKHGFTSGYDAFFLGPKPKTTAALKAYKGIIDVEDDTSAYGTTAGAHTIYVDEVNGAMGDLKGFHHVSFGKLGSESSGYSENTHISGFPHPVTIDVVVWRNGKYVGILSVGSVSMTIGAKDSAVSNLAKKIDSRMSSAH